MIAWTNGNGSPCNVSLQFDQDGHSSSGAGTREEYHLTGQGQASTPSIALNGVNLSVSAGGAMPSLVGRQVGGAEPLLLEPFSYGFLVLPSASVPVCTKLAKDE